MAQPRKSDNPQQQANKLCRKIVAETLIIAEAADVIKDPQIPEVLSNPDFLVVPRLGSLVTIDIQPLPENKKAWEFTLAKIEDLFEIKMSAGSLTIVSLILIRSATSIPNEEAVALLTRMFDHVITVFPNDNIRQEVSDFVRGITINGTVKQGLNYLWGMEAEARQSNYERITKLSYVQEALKNHQEYEEKEPRRKRLLSQKPFTSEITFRAKVENPILEELGAKPAFWVQESPRVMNIKHHLLNSITQYYFTFDFAFSPSQISNEYMDYFDKYYLDTLFQSGGGLGKIIQGSKGTFGRIAILRRLATYARFISYEISNDGPQDRFLRIRLTPPKLFLVMDGNIFGPRYAPDRYLKVLMGTGWRPILLEDFSKRALIEEIDNAN